jgi:predicted CXXCH cytochrome family protein
MKCKRIYSIIPVGILSIALLITLIIITPATLSAKVTGVCSNCHTMHNSQDGTLVGRNGTGTGCFTCHTGKDGVP